MTHYLIRIIKYHWNPLTKVVKHEPVCSKSLFLAEEPTLNQLKSAIKLLSKELSKNSHGKGGKKLG